MTLKDYIREGRANVFPLGLGLKDEKVKMLILTKGVTSSTFCRERMEDIHAFADVSDLYKLTLEIVSLDEFLKTNPLPYVSFIKADVEGSERDLLLGASEVIHCFKPRLSICTYHLPDDYIEIPKIVENFGLNYNIRLKVHGNTLGIMHAW